MTQTLKSILKHRTTLFPVLPQSGTFNVTFSQLCFMQHKQTGHSEMIKHNWRILKLCDECINKQDAEEKYIYNECFSLDEDISVITSHVQIMREVTGGVESLFMCSSINYTTCHFVFVWNPYEITTHTHTHTYHIDPKTEESFSIMESRSVRCGLGNGKGVGEVEQGFGAIIIFILIKFYLKVVKEPLTSAGSIGSLRLYSSPSAAISLLYTGNGQMLSISRHFTRSLEEHEEIWQSRAHTRAWGYASVLLTNMIQ